MSLCVVRECKPNLAIVNDKILSNTLHLISATVTLRKRVILAFPVALSTTIPEFC